MEATPICVRMPADLEAALRTRAEAEGLAISEVIRAIVSQWVYGTIATVDDGYLAGRDLAVKLVHEAATQAIAEHVPRTHAEALARLQELSQRRR